MNKPKTTAQEHQDEICEYLHAMSGLLFTIKELAAKFGCGHSAMRASLSLLLDANRIRQQKMNGNSAVLRYFVPSPDQLESERRLSAQRPFKPLVVDKYRKELHQEIRAERERIKSIG